MFRKQPPQVKWATCFRSRARQPFATERLHTHHRADHIAVHVDVADVRAAYHVSDGFIDPRVNAERQAVTCRADLFEQLVQLAAAVTHHMQHRTEYFALQFVDAVEFDQRRRHKRALSRAFRHRQLLDLAAFLAHRRDMRIDTALRIEVDHRADVDRQAVRIAHRQFAHRARQHFQRAVRNIFL
ncbi:hypothetical protein R69927_07820 [Paraburkholderia domus]|nr:hypothetical protein R69927_07820 [Paraburkholderia domus]